MDWLAAVGLKEEGPKRLTVSERLAIFKKQGGKCDCCGDPMHKRPEYPDDGNSDPRWFTIYREGDFLSGVCRKCNYGLHADMRLDEQYAASDTEGKK